MHACCIPHIFAQGRIIFLYSQTFLSKDKFWEIYGPEDKYFKIKNKYDPNDKLIDFYSKIVRNK